MVLRSWGEERREGEERERGREGGMGGGGGGGGREGEREGGTKGGRGRRERGMIRVVERGLLCAMPVLTLAGLLSV